MKDSIGLKGEFELHAYDKEGNVVHHIKKNNLVVTTGKQNAALLLAGGGGFAIDGIVFGSTGTAPVLGNTYADMTDKFLKAVGAITYPTTNTMQFAWTLEYSENNGATIREFGLVSDRTGTPVLFSRIASDAISKTNIVRLSGTWKITF